MKDEIQALLRCQPDRGPYPQRDTTDDLAAILAAIVAALPTAQQAKIKAALDMMEKEP